MHQTTGCPASRVDTRRRSCPRDARRRSSVIQYADASVIVALIARQGASALVDPLLSQNNGQIVLSDFALAESSCALARLGRVDRWSSDLQKAAFDELDAWVESMSESCQITPEDVALATTFVRLPGVTLRAPDAIHIATAHRLGATLLTLDQGMARAAAEIGVPYFNPAEAEAPGEQRPE
ncbi:MAG: PIN domain-containing protein [Brevundimonas sp.]|nr:MAG: PIN domain-containing protein [Brevundimonas sp.]